GQWVSNGVVFYLQDVSGGLPLTSANTLATVTVGVTSAGCTTRTGSISANPNPIQACDGSRLGITTLSWTSTGTSVVEVNANSPTGALFPQSWPSVTATTGHSVSNGSFPTRRSSALGLPLTSANTLATVTVGVTSAGCPTPRPDSANDAPMLAALAAPQFSDGLVGPDPGLSRS